MVAIRVEDDSEAGAAVRHLVLCRPGEYNTITPELRDELVAALDAADRDRRVRVVLVRAEGRAFCAGFGLDWSTAASDREASAPVWDSVADLQMIGTFGRAFAKLHEISKPTVAAVQGWCIAGGTDMILNADLIVAGESSVFGYPPARVWGVPEAPWVWVARLGLEQAKRYLFTGDEIPGPEAARLGLVLECVPDDQLAGAVRRAGPAHRAAAAQPAPDDEVAVQRRGPPPVPARHVTVARLPVRRRGPPHAGRTRLRRPGPGDRLAGRRARARRAVRRLRQPPAVSVWA